MVKVSLQKFTLTPQEVSYYVSLVAVPLHYANNVVHKEDVLNIPHNLYFAMLVRVVGGFLSDIFLFFALTLTNYSKATTIFFTNTLMIPFMARAILKE
jgi:drug/metabolite transporter (DMT)-like permease